MNDLEVRFAETVGTFHLDVSFHVGEGEVLGLLGRSGNGKSLTLRTIAGIITPEEGSIRIGEHVLFDSQAGVNLPVRERNVGLLFQSYALFPAMTVLENVMCGIKDRDKHARKQQAVDKLSLMGIDAYRGRLPRELSGGQQQRVALARMLASQPDLLMLDEPFSALDHESKQEIDQHLNGLLRHFTGPVLFVSHDPEEVRRYCTRTLSIVEGRVHQENSER
ncbi:MAG: ATP-binding cassette domain-containing protein [Sphaerochaetaceae bacterium]|jgi:ABC-type sulfate/molybdate transport systems ATPase subunit